MGKKINLFHREIETKVLLEVLGVYGVLALALVGVYYFGPAITGFITVTKQLNYTDDVNLEFGESSEYTWNLANPGDLKSIKIDGSKSKEGTARVYIEDNGVRHLIFDSSQLVEKPSGMFGITGFAVLEDGEDADEIKKSIEGNLNEGQQELFDLLVLDINKTRNNVEIGIETDDGKVSKEVKGIATDLQNELINNLSISLENSIENVKIKIEAEFEEEDEEIPINEIPIINETTINKTVEKTINVNLEYGNNEIYDANNDGVESLTGVIDFTVDGSDFNWAVDSGKLCTRYEVYSADNQESTFTCFGNDNCCALVGLGSSRDSWNESLFLSYGSYGSGVDNIVFAQVLYANYSLDIENPYSEIVYSPWGNLTAKFSADVVEFEDVCIDTCMFSGNASSYKLIIEVEDTKLRINKIKYLVEEIVANNAPLLAKEIENISVLMNGEYVLDLNGYFPDDDSDKLIYSYYEMDNISIRFEGNLAYIVPDEGFVGSRFTFITANDSFDGAVSNVFKIEVMASVLSIKMLDSTLAEGIWTVKFSTAGTGNLTIIAVNGTYAELYDNNGSTMDSLDNLKLNCNEFEIFDKNELIETENSWFILMNNSKVKLADLVGQSLQIKGIYVENYNCNDKAAYYTASVLRDSENALEFKFGDMIITASMSYVGGVFGKTFEIRDKEGNKIAVFDSFGNVNIKGNLIQNVSMDIQDGSFVIQNANGIPIAMISPEGNLKLIGSVSENQSLLAPTPNSFIIQNKSGNAVAYVNSTGSLFLKGTLAESVSFG